MLNQIWHTLIIVSFWIEMNFLSCWNFVQPSYLRWKLDFIRVESWDDKGSSWCKSGFCDDFRIGGKTFEFENPRSCKTLYFRFDDFEKVGWFTNLTFLRFFNQSFRAVKGALSHAFQVSVLSLSGTKTMQKVLNFNHWILVPRTVKKWTLRRYSFNSFLYNHSLQCISEVGIQIQITKRNF